MAEENIVIPDKFQKIKDGNYGCRYCCPGINKIDMNDEVDFRLKLGNGQIETELILGIPEENERDTSNPYLEVYRYYTDEKGIALDGFDQSMRIDIKCCPFCGKKL